MKARTKENPDRKCQYCQEKLKGRSDKKFCDDYCRTTFNYEKYKKKPSHYMTVKKQLQLNRKLLSQYNRGGKVSIRKERLINRGFDPHYFTHYWKNAKNEVYLFCFEHGFIKRMINGKMYYILILWQDYMNPSAGIE
jgi:predicted nucleic acid-binding Zn ribbon protein